MHSESRKRPHADDEEDLSSSKKRAMSGASGSPLPNGVTNDSDEPSLNNLELFRKEAIFRRMCHYSRENERSQARIAELEQRKNTCEAGYAAIVACWTQLVETIRLLVKPENLPEADLDTQALFNLARSLPKDSSQELKSALEDKANATRTLVSSFVNFSQQSPSRLSDDNHWLEAQRARTEAAALRSEVATLRSQLQENLDLRESLRTQLTAAENRYERSCSKTVQALEARKAKGAKSEEPEELQQKPSSPSQSVTTPPPVPVNGVHDMYEIGALQDQVKSREAKLVELDRQVAALRDQNAALEVELRMKEQGDNIYENAAYKDVVQFALRLDADLADKYKQTIALENDITRLTTGIEKHDSEILAGTVRQLQELQAMLQKRDSDNARLREQRDQQNAELVERRHKDSVKATSLEQSKLLVESRGERITQLELELNRCKSHLAAQTGDKQLLLTYLHGDDPQRERWEIIQERLNQANRQVSAMQQTLTSYDEDAQNAIQEQAEISRRVLELTEEVDKYRALFGAKSSPNLIELTQRLKDKEDEIEKYKLLELQRGEAEKSLYAELDKLSSAWETLDRQVKSKAFDLASLEERLSKSLMEKAKAENKFYSAMRDKEAMEGEKKTFVKMLEKQGKAVEKLVDTEASLKDQINLLEKETAMQKRSIDSLKENIRNLERNNSELFSRAEIDKNKCEAWKHVHREFQLRVEAKTMELRQLEDSLIRARKEAERQGARMKDPVALPSDVEDLKTILKCSTCRINFRSTVITKCMHTFCKDCVEKRIQTRQRKCPACNISFAQSEVQQIWFQ